MTPMEGGEARAGIRDDPGRTAGDGRPEAESAELRAGCRAGRRPGADGQPLGEYTRIWLRRIRSGESGALPVVIGLVAIVVYFQARNSLFLSAGNLVNLMTQAAFIMTLGMAEVFVLLLGEIDLSSGFNAALGAVIMTWMLATTNPFPWWLAVLAGLAFSAAFARGRGFHHHQAETAVVRGDAGRLSGGPWAADLPHRRGGARFRRDDPADQHRHLQHRGRQPQPDSGLDRPGGGRGARRRVHDAARRAAGGPTTLPPRPPA